MDNESIEYLKNFKSLLDEGLISREEFEQKKKELLPLESPSDTIDQEIQDSLRIKRIVKPGDIVWIVPGALLVLYGLFNVLNTASLDAATSALYFLVIGLGSICLSKGIGRILDSRSTLERKIFDE